MRPRVDGDTPICVPKTVCAHCKNSDATTGSSGINASCEAAARTDQDTIRIDCQLLAMAGSAAGTVSPCTDAGKPLDLAAFIGPGWGCLPGRCTGSRALAAWVDDARRILAGRWHIHRPPTTASTRTAAWDRPAPPALAFSFTGTEHTTFPDEPSTDVVALFGFAMHAPAGNHPVRADRDAVPALVHDRERVPAARSACDHVSGPIAERQPDG